MATIFVLDSTFTLIDGVDVSLIKSSFLGGQYDRMPGD